MTFFVAKEIHESPIKVAVIPNRAANRDIGISATLKMKAAAIFAYKHSFMAKKGKGNVTLDDVQNETLALFHRLIGRLERLTQNCEDPGTINQALKTTADFLVKLNKERELGNDDIGSLLQQTLHGIGGV